MSRSAVVIGMGAVAEALARQIAGSPGWELDMLVSSAGGTSRMEKLAAAVGARYRPTEHVNGQALVEEIEHISPDFVFSADNQQKLCRALLAAARVGAVNFHNGPLPAYRGLNIPSWVIWNEEPTHAISWHWMLDKLDAGATVLAPAVEIDAEETAFSLTLKCVQAAVDSVPDLLETLKTAPPNLADHSNGGRYFRRIDIPNGGVIDESWSARKILRLYRAMSYGRLPVKVPPITWRRASRVLTVKSMRLLTREMPTPPSPFQATLPRPDGVLLITTLEPVGA